MISLLAEIILLTGSTSPLCNKWGGYYDSPNYITVCQTNKNSMVLEHEISHYIYYQKLTEKQRQLWKYLSNKSGKYDYVSEYARTHTDEDFAETITQVMINDIEYSEFSKVMKQKYKYARIVIDKFTLNQ